jgi:hypothetical protein
MTFNSITIFHPSSTTSCSRLKITSQLQIVILSLLFCVVVQASQSQKETELTTESLTCTLYQVATQSADIHRSESLYCEDENGLSYEVQGQLTDINIQFALTNKIIDKKLTDSVLQLTSINLTQSAKLNSAKSRLRQQLKQAAHPKLNISHFQWHSDKIIMTEQTNWSIFWDENKIEKKLNNLKVADESLLLAAAKGINERTALVIHVTANDFSNTSTPAELGDSVFGTNGDPVNLTSQFAACSYGQQIIMPAQGQHITNGVVEITIDMNVEDVSRGTVRNAVVAAANTLFGSLSTQADHFLFALPPNTGGDWIAYGSINGTYTTYNNRWATYVSAQMHELGHNFGMGHSGIGSSEYADKSGMMGVSYSSDDGPKMCFNSAKSSKFDWYSDKELTFYESDLAGAQSIWTGRLVGVTNYDQAAADQYLLLKIHTIDGDESSSSLNINFNRDAGINDGTRTGKNRIMVVSTAFPTGYNTSLLEANLGSGESQDFKGFWPSGRSLVITVNDISTDNNGLMYADLEIDASGLVFKDGFDLSNQ